MWICIRSETPYPADIQNEIACHEYRNETCFDIRFRGQSYNINLNTGMQTINDIYLDYI